MAPPPRPSQIAGVSTDPTPSLPNEPDPELIAEGGRLARVNLWRLFAISAVVSWVGRGGPDGVAGWLRLALIGLFCVLVYRGMRWALVVLGLLTVLAGVLMVGLAFVMADMPAASRLLLGVLGVVQVSAFLILYNAPEVRAFMAARRAAAAHRS